jgi:hypothetical protein
MEQWIGYGILWAYDSTRLDSTIRTHLGYYMRLLWKSKGRIWEGKNRMDCCLGMGKSHGTCQNDFDIDGLVSDMRRLGS